MKIATTTADFRKFCQNDIERIRELHRAGFRYVDLNMYSFTPDCVYMQDDWKKAVSELKAEADRLGMTFVQAHSQGGNPLHEDPAHVEFLIAATIRSIEICHELGIKNTVVHPGFAKDICKEEWFERNKQFFTRLFPAMEAFGVNVLTENSTASNMGDRYFANTGKDMLDFLHFVGHPQLHACWDTGHANCEGPQYDEILALGSELYAIHYNDNRGKRDEHLIPYLGTLNHDEVLHALIDVGFKGYFTLECDASLTTPKSWPFKRREYAPDTRLAEPQLFMQRRVEELMYETAKHILSAYDLFEA